MQAVLSDNLALLHRYLLHIARMPERLLAVTLMPVLYVVVLGYLFGSMVVLPEGDYREYLMAGIMAQTMLTNVTNTALSVADDLRNGLVERFGSLPMSQSSVLFARTATSVLLSVVSLLMMTAVGLLIGWRVEDPLLALGGFGVLLLLGYAMAWIGAWIGLALRSAESINAVALVVVVPMTFLSTAFIPTSTLPEWLGVVCEWNPLSAVVNAARELFGNSTNVAGSALPTLYPIPSALLLCAALLLVAVPLALRAHQRALSR
ncbi:MAG TPA: ABC transporter permease [Thermobifida alba]|nr:ABC transporter permease [Thermobifida alba]